MTTAEPYAATSARSPERIRAVRVSNVYGAVGPALAGWYVLGTWSAPHRPVMLGVLGVMLVVAVLGWWQAPRIARSPARVVLQLSGVIVNLAGSAVLGTLDGGVASPLGELIPFSLVFFAILVPPPVFGAVSVAGLLAYWGIVVAGGPAPSGYAFVHTLGFGGTAYLCLRHAGVLVSLRHRLAELSLVDPLTGCLNRRGFDERLEQELAEAARTGDPVTLVLVDLDRFKDVNDTYGHQAGDELLAWTGRTLARELSTHDAVGRLGGDEFAVILGGTGADGAAVLVERLRAALHGPAPASFGCASVPAEVATDTDPTQCANALMRAADQRLYADKAARDRRVPSADAVAAARAQIKPQTRAVISRRERRRHSIGDTGRLGVTKGIVGLLYVGFFAVNHPHRLGMAVLSMVGATLGLITVAAAGRLSRSPSARIAMNVIAVVFFAAETGVCSLDGGVSAPTGVTLLLVGPLVALGTRARAVLPALSAVSLLYLGVAVFAGASSGWYVATHLANAIAASLACALQGRAAARQRELVTHLSRVDVLTGCLNRRGFEERFTAELAHARRAGRPAALLLLDLDGFKQLNDSCGHTTGDELLSWVGRTLRDCLHAGDVVGRLGGDEFVVFVGSGTGTDADAVATHVRSALATRTPVSIGAATVGCDGDDFDTLYASADARLYADKARRRGQRPSTPSALAVTDIRSGLPH